MLEPWLFGSIVDTALKTANLQNLYSLIQFFIFVRVGVFFVFVARSYTLQYIGHNIAQNLRFDLFSHIQKHPLVFFDKNSSGSLVTKLTNDLVTLAELFSSTTVNALADLFMLFGVATAMFFFHMKLALATLAVTPLFLFIIWYLKQQIRKAFRVSRESLAMVNGFISENITGIEIIQAFGRENERAEKFDNLNSDLKNSQLNSTFYNSLFNPFSIATNAFIVTIIVLYGSYLIKSNEISVGFLVSFIAYTEYLFRPINSLSEKMAVFQNAFAAGERVFSLLDEENASGGNSGEALQTFSDCIEFKNVSFSYSNDKKVLKNVCFKIKKGESIAIVGHTGAGKTTIISLLEGFYAINNGAILIDGKNINEINKNSLRRIFALIQQDPFIFSGTLKDNILLGADETTTKELVVIMKQLKLDTLMANLTEGLHTKIFERGSNLSTGQKQLIAFARALSHKPEVLILDEATASIDSQTETIIQKALTSLMKEKTCIIIAHRLSTIQSCDRILVFHKGQLVETGIHQDLLALNGYYKALCDLQFAKV